MCNFAGIDLGVEAAPDETTVCKFRHLLEKNKLGQTLQANVNEHLRRSGIKITTARLSMRRS
jgi:IS5 family transposase